MIFRFTLSYSIDTIIEAGEVETLPPLDEWLSNSEASRVPWTLGATPSVSLNNEVSEILYVDYDFVDGIEYTITCSYVKDVTGSDGPPRFLNLVVYNDSFVSQFNQYASGFNANGDLTSTVSLTFTATSLCKKVGIQTQYGGVATITINEVTLGLDQPADTVVTTSDSLVISEPEGWSEAVLKLERDENFHSLIEHFEGEFIFYGNNGVQNGGIDFIKHVESTYGPDADLEILIEISFNGYDYEEVFRGLLDLSTIIEMKDNLLQCAIVRNDFWTKFITRQETQVDLQDPESVDGDPITVYDSVNLSMLPQRLIQTFYGYNSEGYRVIDSDYINKYIAFDVFYAELDEVEEKYSLPVLTNTERPVWILEPKYSGTYSFNLRLEASIYQGIGGGVSEMLDGANRVMQVYIQKNDDSAIAFSIADFNSESTVYSYSGDIELNVGDIIRIYMFFDFEIPGVGTTLLIWGNTNDNILDLSNNPLTTPIPSGAEVPTYMRITADTLFPTTNSEGFLIHDAAAHICDRIIGRDNTFYSEFLGGLLTIALQYGSDGCAWFYMLLKGLQIRQYSLLEKPFFMSFKQWWDGANPILNLGLGYETIDSVTQSLLLNDSFDTSSAWTNEDTGNDWTVGSGSAVVNFVNDPSKKLTQTIENTVGGGYSMSGYYLTSGIIFGSNRIRLRIIVVDDQGTETIIKSLTPLFDVTPSSGHPDFDADFTSSNPIVSIYAIVEIIQGFGHNYQVTLNSLTLSGPVGGDEVIRVEEKAHFYQNEIAVYFSNVREIRRMYDHDYFFNNVEMGYKKWQSEDVSGIDDPQTKRTWTSRFKKLGKKISILSDWIAAGLTIEKTRRTTREKSADYKYDNDVFIVAINPVPVDISPETSPDVVDFEPELDENFSSVINLNNSDSRYNLRLTPGRNFLRWINYLSGCLQNYVTSFFKFSSGEGNYDMRSTMTDTSPDCSEADYGGAQLSEKGNIQVSSDYLFIPVPIEIEIPMEWEEYKMIDRKKAIGISQTSDNHEAFFIKTLDYKIAQGVASGVLWPKDIFGLSIVTDVPATRMCIPVEEQECAILLETGEVMLTESGETMILESC